MKARQGRLAEAEADTRRALLGRLKDQGKYHATTPRFIGGLARILMNQGRFADAEALLRAAVEINSKLGVVGDSPSSIHLRSFLAGSLTGQRKHAEAAKLYADIDKDTVNWESWQRQAFELNTSRIFHLYFSGQVEQGIAASEALVKRETARVGAEHFDTAIARGTLAFGYMKAGKSVSAVNEFKQAMPYFVSAVRETAHDDNPALVVAVRRRMQNFTEAYIGLLAQSSPATAGDVASETFGLADSIRGQSVQHALTDSTARMSAKDPELTALIRREQDLAKQVNAQLGVLNNALELPAGQRDELAVKALNAAIAKTRLDRDEARAELSRRFPAYADLVDPKPATVGNVREVLREDEALISFYFGREKSFVWAVPKHGTVAFAPIAVTAEELKKKVDKLREALNPDVRTIADIPRFDVGAAHELYRLLLEPVKGGWHSAKSLIVMTNGALGLLPVSLLPTAPASVATDDEPPFASYRHVPWLARTHAVSMVPSASALRALRQQPSASGNRDPIVGFGDPLFSVEQAEEAERQIPKSPSVKVADASGRNVRFRRRATIADMQVDSADLALLPRLPDTADELISIARSMGADPARAIYLGKDANEDKVKETDLSRFRVVAFATHGLVPGDLNGLTQPALALSAPKVAHVEGDGLLTMAEVLPLKLDADWVVLSACNTAAGSVTGAEAVSGLGRAFFYAGSRALLVTNWPVHSRSARELVTALFHQQAADASLTRAEALRRAMISLMDGPGYTDAGKVLFTYAHPLFWAPYSLVGDGGGR
jgi:CHAT domain-containing protein